MLIRTESENIDKKQTKPTQPHCDGSLNISTPVALALYNDKALAVELINISDWFQRQIW